MAGGILVGKAALLTLLSCSRSPPRTCASEWAPRPRPHEAGPSLRLPLRRRGAPAAKFAASAAAGGEGNNGENGGDEGEQREWEAELTRRLKEAEEMEELERKAEELQTQATADGADSGESEEEKRDRVRRELEKVAREQAERRATAKQMFDLGQKAYGRGMYGRSIEFLEGALTVIRPNSLLGGEIQIWLAMAYEANRRHRDCIALYKELESGHPMINIRRQAAELRYILEAPKLKISNEEVVTIPPIGTSWDWYAVTWSDKAKDQEKRRKKAASNPDQPSTGIFGNFSFLRPPSDWKKNAWVIVTLWAFLIGTALYLQR